MMTRLTEAELDARFLCVGCGVDTNATTGIKEYYVVEEDVWAQTGLGQQDGMLCIGCLEYAIGRELTPEDFKNCCANLDHRASDRLLQRRQRGGNDDLRALLTLRKAFVTQDVHLSLILTEVLDYAGRRAS